MFLVDGLDVLFRVALCILRGNEQELLRCESIPAVYVALESLPTRMWEPDKLLQVCFVLCSASIWWGPWSADDAWQLEADLRFTVVRADIIKRHNRHVAGLQQVIN